MLFVAMVLDSEHQAMTFYQKTAWERSVSISHYASDDEKPLVESRSWRRTVAKSRSWSSDINRASRGWDHGLRLSAAWSLGEGQ